MAGIILRCCLAQSGLPMSFSSIGGGTIRIDFDDTEIPNAVALLALRDTPLIITIEADSGSELIQRRGRPRKDSAE